MAVTFEMIGKLSISKDSEKFKAYDEMKFDSGWVNRTLRFNCVSGSNRFTLKVQGGCYEDMHNSILLFTRDGVDDSGKKIKGEKISIPFKERLTHPKLEQIAEWKKFVIDLEIPSRRWALKNALDKRKEGKELTDEEIESLNIKGVDDLESEYEKSCKKRKEFVSEWDYAEYIKKIIDSGKFADSKFKIRGEHRWEYSEQNQRFYDNFVPSRIYLASEEDKESATETVVLYFNEDSLVDASEEQNKYFVKGKIFVYDSNRKEDIPCDYTFSFPTVSDDADEDLKRAVKAKIRKFTTEDTTWREIGVINTLVDGASSSKITMEDLDEETQDDILLGLTTLEDVQAELGGVIYGEHVREAVFFKLAKGFTRGSKESTYTDEDMEIKPLSTEEDEEDLFDEDEDLF